MAINKRLKEVAKLLKNLVAYAISWLEETLQEVEPELAKRRTEIKKFSAVDVREVVKRDMSLRYDGKTGYLGTGISTGDELLQVTPYDRVLFIRKSGIYTVCQAPEKVFVDTGMWWCGFADRETLSKTLFTIVYRDPATKFCSIKRCRIEQFISNRDYPLVPEGMEVLHISTDKNFRFKLHYVEKPRIKIREEEFSASDYEEKGSRTLGVRLSVRETERLEVLKTRSRATATKSKPALNEGKEEEEK